MSKFFVMLNHPSPNVPAVPMADDEDIAFYDTEDAAREAANNSILGEKFGFEIFELGTGL